MQMIYTIFHRSELTITFQYQSELYYSRVVYLLRCCFMDVYKVGLVVIFEPAITNISIFLWISAIRTFDENAVLN